MAHTSHERLVDISQDVSRRSLILSNRLLGAKALLGLDYVSIFTKTQTEYEELSVAASSLGTKVYDKRGGVYSIKNEAFASTLASPILRVSEPGDTQLIGCADVVPVSFEESREVLLDAGYEEKQKSLHGQEYTIIEIVDFELGVAMYLPSLQMTRVMDIHR